MATRLDTYRLLGRSGLRVSPLALGTATFGTEWGWGVEKDQARALFDTYVDNGGNFIDTAGTYTGGTAEKMVGEFARDRRDSLVLATKYTTLRRAGDPNSGGAHRKSLVTSVEASLRSLQTDYIDILFVHVWDFHTSPEEVVRALDDLVRQGKVLYIAMSNAPAWQVARMQTTADLRGWSPLIALQTEYSLISRGPESDLIPMARELGLGVTPYSPLGGGVLSGKYTRSDLVDTEDVAGESNRKSANRALGMVTPRTLAIADKVSDIAREIGCSPAHVALSWNVNQPGVVSPIIGARTTEQLNDNIRALDITPSDEHRRRLDDVSAIDRGYPHELLASNHIRTVVQGDLSVEARS